MATNSQTAKIKKAEKRVLRAAMSIIDKDGWAFQFQGEGAVPVACRPGALRGLEGAIANLKDARKRK